MATYAPPKAATAYIIYVALVSQADTKLMQVNPTIAAGDFKVSIDGGALANLATLPAVTPAGSVMVKISLSSGEMTGDNITVVCIDAAGAEWCSLVINLQTAARQFDDLAYPTTSGRSLDVTATGEAGIDWANVGAPTTTLALSGTTVGVVTALGAQAKTDVNAEVLDVLTVDTFAEASAVPAATSTLKNKLNWLFILARNKLTQTSVTQTILADDGTTPVATATVSDDTVTFTRNEFS